MRLKKIHKNHYLTACEVFDDLKNVFNEKRGAKRKVEMKYPYKHVLWGVDICNILLRRGIFPNILLLINPKYYQLLSEGHPFQISSAYNESEL